MPDDDPVRLGRDNSAFSTTFVQRTAPENEIGEFLETLIVENSNGSGVTARAGGSIGTGVTGEASTGPGVFGRTTSPTHGGVQGFNLAGEGIVGISTTGNAVRGTATQAGIGVQGTASGVNPTTGIGGIGVAGVARDGIAGFFSGRVESKTGPYLRTATRSSTQPAARRSVSITRSTRPRSICSTAPWSPRT